MKIKKKTLLTLLISIAVLLGGYFGYDIVVKPKIEVEQTIKVCEKCGKAIRDGECLYCNPLDSAVVDSVEAANSE